MKLLSFHSFSLYMNGGSNRIFRRIYEGRESNVLVLMVALSKTEVEKGAVAEIIVPAFLQNKAWMRWHLRMFIRWLSWKFFKGITEARLQKKAIYLEFDILHVLDQGPFSDALCRESILLGKPLWVSFHDHFSTVGSSFRSANKLWNLADRRFVISDELGFEYSTIFGKKDYEIITDGLKGHEIKEPFLSRTKTEINIYFAGLLHIDYYPLFKSLGYALDDLSSSDLNFKVTLRGTQQLFFFKNRLFKVEYLPFTLDEDKLISELNDANILYLPMKFTPPNYSKYSLSTKMVGYLAARGTIFYHGPFDSAAANLLSRYNAAICCDSIETSDVKKSIIQIMLAGSNYSQQAKKLAKDKFNMQNIKKSFWHD